MSAFSTSTYKSFFFVHTDVSNLSGRTKRAGNNLSIVYDTSANSCSQRDHDQIFVSLTTTFPHFSKSCCIGIVCYLYF